MKPASKGGTNAFDNCQLTSSWYNNKKRADYSRTDADWKEFDDARKKRSVRATVIKQRPTIDKYKTFAEDQKKKQAAAAIKRRAQPAKPTIV